MEAVAAVANDYFVGTVAVAVVANATVDDDDDVNDAHELFAVPDEQALVVSLATNTKLGLWWYYLPSTLKYRSVLRDCQSA